jgi:hypothetical protein
VYTEFCICIFSACDILRMSQAGRCGRTRGLRRFRSVAVGRRGDWPKVRRARPRWWRRAARRPWWRRCGCTRGLLCGGQAGPASGLQAGRPGGCIGGDTQQLSSLCLSCRDSESAESAESKAGFLLLGRAADVGHSAVRLPPFAHCIRHGFVTFAGGAPGACGGSRACSTS